MEFTFLDNLFDLPPPRTRQAPKPQAHRNEYNGVARAIGKLSKRIADIDERTKAIPNTISEAPTVPITQPKPPEETAPTVPATVISKEKEETIAEPATT